jgi:hypothetical protein
VTALLDVAIGLILLYLILSLVASAVNEALAGLFQRRGAFLAKGIQNLLGDVMAGRFFRHPLVQALGRGTKKPSYVSAQVFSRALLDLVGGLPAPAAGAAPGGGSGAGAPGLASFRSGYLVASRDPQVAAIQATLEGLVGLPPADLQASGGQAVLGLGQALGALARESSDLADLEGKVESWYDEAMDRVSGWYKRRTSIIVFAIGVVLVGALNADTINVARILWAHPEVQAAAVAQAEKTVQSPAGTTATPSPADAASAVAGLAQLQVPLGWLSPAVPADPRDVPGDAAGWLVKIAGLFLTGIAITFGAPFWFGLLKGFVGLSGPPPASSSGA